MGERTISERDVEALALTYDRVEVVPGSTDRNVPAWKAVCWRRTASGSLRLVTVLRMRRG